MRLDRTTMIARIPQRSLMPSAMSPASATALSLALQGSREVVTFIFTVISPALLGCLFITAQIERSGSPRLPVPVPASEGPRIP
jgi:hypothetical protein